MPISSKLAIRLALHGCTNRPFYHIVVMHKHKGSDKNPLEQLGTYDPMKNEHNEVLIALNFDRLKYWMAKGARPTKPIEKILGLAGFFPLHPMTFVTAERNRNTVESASNQSESQSDTAESQSAS